MYASSKSCPDFGDREVDSSTGFDTGIESEAFTFGVRTDLDGGIVGDLDRQTDAHIHTYLTISLFLSM